MNNIFKLIHFNNLSIKPSITFLGADEDQIFGNIYLTIYSSNDKEYIISKAIISFGLENPTIEEINKKWKSILKKLNIEKSNHTYIYNHIEHIWK